MPIAPWRAALVKDFAVPSTALKSLERRVMKKLQATVEQYLTFACDETRSAVLRVLDECGVPSSLLQLQRFRLAHVRFIAGQEHNELAAALQEEEVEKKRQLQLALSVLQDKFGLPSVSRVDREKSIISIGTDYLFRYSVTGGNVDWELIDPQTHCAVKIFSGDPPERLGSALHELCELRMEWERKQVPDPKKTVEDDKEPAWVDPNSDATTGAPPDDESGRGTV